MTSRNMPQHKYPTEGLPDTLFALGNGLQYCKLACARKFYNIIAAMAWSILPAPVPSLLMVW